MTKKGISGIFLLSVFIIAIILYYFFNPENSGYFPKCPFHALTGYDCPGCGSQRAIHHLLHLNFQKAFSYNPLLILSIPYLLAGFYFEYFGGKEKYPIARNRFFGKNATVLALVIVMLYWVGRNILPLG